MITTCLFWFAQYVYRPFLTPYLLGVGVSATAVGVIIGVYALVQLVLRIPQGVMADSMGRHKLFIVWGMVCAALAALGMLIYPSPVLVFIANAVSGLASTMWVSFTVLYASYYEENQTGKAMGVINAVCQVGFLAAYITGGFLYQYMDLKILFLVSFAVGAVGALVSLFIKETPRPRVAASMKKVLAVLKDKTLIVSSLLAVLVQTVVFGTAQSFTASVAQSIGADGLGIGALSAIFTVSSILGSYFIATKAGARMGRKWMSVVGFSCLLIYCVAVPLAPNMSALYTVQFIGGLGNSSLISIFMTSSIQHFPAEKKATAMGFYQAVYSLGSTIGPIMLGAVADASNYTTAFFAVGLAAVVGIAVVITAYKKKILR